MANAGSTNVAFVTLDLDAGTYSNLPEGQRMLADNLTVNATVLSAIAPVPEPATWAMLIAGFGGVGALMRRRRSVGQFAA